MTIIKYFRKGKTTSKTKCPVHPAEVVQEVAQEVGIEAEDEAEAGAGTDQDPDQDADDPTADRLRRIRKVADFT